MVETLPCPPAGPRAVPDGRGWPEGASFLQQLRQLLELSPGAELAEILAEFSRQLEQAEGLVENHEIYWVDLRELLELEPDTSLPEIVATVAQLVDAQ